MLIILISSNHFRPIVFCVKIGGQRWRSAGSYNSSEAIKQNPKSLSHVSMNYCHVFCFADVHQSEQRPLLFQISAFFHCKTSEELGCLTSFTVVYKTSWAVVNLRNWFFCSWILWLNEIELVITFMHLWHQLIYLIYMFLIPFFSFLSYLYQYAHGTLSLTYWGWLSSSHGDYNIGHSALYKLLMLSHVVGMKWKSISK